jgi:NDP-sugar pyrophosphorylase family protein
MSTRARTPLPVALVLAAGLGTRARPLSWLRAKPALPVAGAPLIARVLRWLGSHGVRDVIVNLHYRPESIAAVVGDGSRFGVRARYSWEQPLLGSGGGPVRAFSLVDGDELLVVNGDTLTDLDPAALYAAHAASDALVTMALVENPRPWKYGGVQVGASGVVERFTRPGHEPPGLHFLGVQVVRRAAFAGVPDGQPAESVAAIYPALMAARPVSVRGWIVSARFDDIGTPADYLDTCLRLSEGVQAALIEPGSRVSASARLSDTICWTGAVVEDGALLESCVVCSGACVPRGSRYHRSVLLPADEFGGVSDEYRQGALTVWPLDSPA